ncbi:ABC transporter ATP-binding protein [Desulfatirhabdium butyrativorans]|uniref:ABC transporter ATP-binding protein n=1 Tax=Desulfatirhabdium butyrativorans TaxID=340467 RepID=UPI0004082285|nr:ABC transporter ATP-binding protein [Desulfatirhabdium butyrativorans]
MLLEVDAIHSYYGDSHILFDVSLKIDAGEIVCLLGRNGAGKSTTMKSIIGLVPPRKGSILFRGRQCVGLKPYRIARLGIGFVPDDRRVFADLTVGENLDIVVRKDTPNGSWNKDAVYDFFPALRKIDGRRAGFLSGGEQQMLTIGRALMTNPDLLLLDEPTEGLAPLVVALLAERIVMLKERGLTVLLAEQNQKVALDISDRVYLIDNGAVRFSGTVEALRRQPEVLKSTLSI